MAEKEKSPKGGSWTSSQWYSDQRVSKVPRYWQPNDDGMTTHLAYITDAEIELLKKEAKKQGGSLVARPGPAGLPFFASPKMLITNRTAPGKKATNVPIGWKSSPDHPMARLVYVTDEQAEFLKKMDIHDSGVDEHDHYGPDNVPSYQGDGGGGGDGGDGGGGGGGDGGGGGNGGDSSSSSDSSTTSDTTSDTGFGYADPGYSQGITDPGYTAPDTAPSTTTDTPSIDTSPDSLDTGLASESFSSPDTGVSDAAPSGSRSFSPSAAPAPTQDDTEFGDLAAAIASQTPSTTSLSPAQTQEALEAATAQTPAPTTLSPEQTQAALEAAAATATQTSGRGGTSGMVATNGMSYADLAALSQAGFGKMDISPTQTVDQAIAAMNAHAALNSNLPGIMTAITGNPAFGQAISIAQGIQGLMSGQLSIGQATVNTAISAVAQALGVPAGLVTGVVNGNPGQAVSSVTTGMIGQAMTAALSQLTGIAPATISATLGVTGVTPAVGQAISGAVNNALGVTPSGQTNTAAAGQAITDAVSGITDAVSGAFSGGSPGTTSGAPTGTTSSDSGGTETAGTTTGTTAGGTTGGTSGGTSGGSSINLMDILAGLAGAGAATSAISRTSTDEPMGNVGLPVYETMSKFEGPLDQFLDLVEKGSYVEPPAQQQAENRSAAMQQDRLDEPTYFSYGAEPSIDNALFGYQNFDPAPMPQFGPDGQMLPQMAYVDRLSEPTMMKSGGLAAPLMAAGGTTRYGRYAGGGLNVVHHSGKPRLDFREGAAVTGEGDGQSDDIPAMLADGEFVFPADVVAALGNGSTKAGSDKLYDMMHAIRAHHRSAKPKDLPPPAKKSPLDYLKKSTRKERG